MLDVMAPAPRWAALRAPEGVLGAGVVDAAALAAAPVILSYPDLAALAAADHPDPAPGTRIHVAERVPGRGGGGFWRTVAAAPGHPLTASSNGGAALWELDEPAVTPEMAGAAGDGVADDAPALQAADDYAAIRGAPVLLAGKSYRLEATVTKSTRTAWRGAGQGSAGTGGTRLLVRHDGDGIVLDDGGTSYFNGSISSLRIEGAPAFPSARGLVLRNGVRQQKFADLSIRTFDLGISAQGGGELYFDRCFISQCAVCVALSGVADSWLYATHAGSGPSWSGAGGHGFQLTSGCDNVTFTACRGQVAHPSGNGFRIVDSSDIRLMGCIVDDNRGAGVWISGDSSNVTLGDCDLFDNGEAGGGHAGVQVSAAGSTISSIRILGCSFRHKHKTVQERGITLLVDGSGSLDRVLIAGNDLSAMATPLHRTGAGAATAVTASGNHGVGAAAPAAPLAAAAPDAPEPGAIVQADGVSWDPLGRGSGPYLAWWTGAAWAGAAD